MSRASKIMIAVFLAGVIASSFLTFERYMLNEEFQIFVSEDEIPDPFDISSYK